jgi:hypothetical protein
MSTEVPPPRADAAAAAKLQILATEHWSLLATRAITYNESLSRVTIFLAILSGAVIALALVAQADSFGPAFIAIAIPILAVVLFTGIATISRLTALNRDDYRWVIAMNRLRNGYLELHPELAANFTTSPYDDLPGALLTLGIDPPTGGERRPVPRLGSVLHLVHTLPGMLSIIVSAVAGAIGALAALALSLSPVLVVFVAAIGFMVAILLLGMWNRQSVTTLSPSLEPRFSTPGRTDSDG